MKNFKTSLKFMVIMTILTGVIYPLLVTGISQFLFKEQADGSLIRNSQGNVIGSELIAQNFKNAKYFWPRPSAIGFNPMPSGGSNLGPTSQDLLAKVKERKAQGLSEEMLYASASGLDPHVSPHSAYQQVVRVAKARGMSEEDVRVTIAEYTEKRQLGFLGEERVNVFRLNLALDSALVEGGQTEGISGR